MCSPSYLCWVDEATDLGASKEKQTLFEKTWYCPRLSLLKKWSSKLGDIGIVSKTWNLPSLCVSALTRPSNCQKLVQLPLPIITDFYRSDRIVTQKIGSHACKSWRKYNVEVCQFIVFAFEMTGGQIWHIWQSRKFRRDILWQLIVVFNVVVEKRISVIVPWLLISSRLMLSSLLYCEGLLLAEKQDLLALTGAPVCHWNLI